jgi:iron complex outermembrane receptor protein
MTGSAMLSAPSISRKRRKRSGRNAFSACSDRSAAIIQSDYGSHTKAFALYSQLDFKMTDALKLTLGGRYTHESKDIRRFFAAGSPLATVINLPYGGVPDAKYNNFSPAATLSYEASDAVNVYARFARGFKSGGFNGETNIFFDPGAPAGCPSGLTELCALSSRKGGQL